MAHYRIYLKDSDEQIVSHTSVECASDYEACMVAEKLVKAGVQAEVWDRVRRVWPTGLSIASDRYRFIN